MHAYILYAYIFCSVLIAESYSAGAYDEGAYLYNEGYEEEAYAEEGAYAESYGEEPYTAASGGVVTVSSTDSGVEVFNDDHSAIGLYVCVIGCRTVFRHAHCMIMKERKTMSSLSAQERSSPSPIRTMKVDGGRENMTGKYVSLSICHERSTGLRDVFNCYSCSLLRPCWECRWGLSPATTWSFVRPLGTVMWPWKRKERESFEVVSSIHSHVTLQYITLIHTHKIRFHRQNNVLKRRYFTCR